MQQTFRPGSVGALMDEYEHAARELKQVLASMTKAEYDTIVDPKAGNPDLQSIHAMTRHVLGAGYGYATYISVALGKPIERPKALPASYEEAAEKIDAMLAFTDTVVQPHYTMPEDDMNKVSIIVPWNVPYELEQMLEHAVCHVHRHRRQMEKFLGVMRNENQ